MARCTWPTTINDRSEEQHQLPRSRTKNSVGTEPRDTTCKIWEGKLNLRAQCQAESTWPLCHMALIPAKALGRISCSVTCWGAPSWLQLNGSQPSCLSAGDQSLRLLSIQWASEDTTHPSHLPNTGKDRFCFKVSKSQASLKRGILGRAKGLLPIWICIEKRWWQTLKPTSIIYFMNTPFSRVKSPLSNSLA